MTRKAKKPTHTEPQGDNPHVYPLGDTRTHSVGNDPCWCNPQEQDGVIVHNSADGREDFETGKRKPS